MYFLSSIILVCGYLLVDYFTCRNDDEWVIDIRDMVIMLVIFLIGPTVVMILLFIGVMVCVGTVIGKVMTWLEHIEIRIKN